MLLRPDPRIDTLPIDGQHACYVIDDALSDPEHWVDYAASAWAQAVESPHNAYPGPELRMPDALSAELDDFLRLHLRARFGVRRTLRMYSRLAMAVRPARDLAPRQWLPHRDRMGMRPDERAVACVLYLFRDPALGGTAFFLPRQPMSAVERLIDESARLDGVAFRDRHGIAPGYPTMPGAWFDKVLSVAPRWNRLIVYDGSLFHSSDIAQPERLSTDPRRGRLTWNGFWVCRRKAAGDQL